MTKKQIPDEKQPIVATEGAEAPFLLYSGDDEKVHVRVLIYAESLWLTQRLMADLFQTSADNINLHLKNIFAESELEESATTEDFSVVQNEGGRAVRRTLKHYTALMPLLLLATALVPSALPSFASGQLRSSKRIFVKALYWMMNG